MDERNLAGRAPWWFRKLVDAETAEFARLRKEDPMYARRMLNARADGADPVTPVYPGDELTVAQKLEKYGIVREPGDEARSLAAARRYVTPAAQASPPPPVDAPVPEGYLNNWESKRSEVGF